MSALQNATKRARVTKTKTNKKANNNNDNNNNVSECEEKGEEKTHTCFSTKRAGAETKRAAAHVMPHLAAVGYLSLIHI